VNLLNRVGGLLLALLVLILVVAGYRSATGREIVAPLRQSGSRIVQWVRSNVPTVSGVAGNGWAALAVGFGLFALAMIFIPGVRGGRFMVATAVICTILAYLAYRPSLVP